MTKYAFLAGAAAALVISTPAFADSAKARKRFLLLLFILLSLFAEERGHNPTNRRAI